MQANTSKFFANLPAAREFAAKQGILAFESYTHTPFGGVKLTWRPLRLSVARGKTSDITHGRKYEVLRETQHAYLIRNDASKFMKVNRYTMIGGKAMFQTH